MVMLKAVSAMEKCFFDDAWDAVHETNRLCGLKEELCAFQVLYSADDPNEYPHVWKDLCVETESPLNAYVTVRHLEPVPVRYPCPPGAVCEDFVRTAPGIFPDLLQPLDRCRELFPTYGVIKSLFVTVCAPADTAAGDYPIRVIVRDADTGEEQGSVTVLFHCLNAVLPPQTMAVTEWFHGDCLADYYHCEIFSEEHWHIMENFIGCAVKNGINTLLTPVFTPPLDTKIGHERPTVQLVDITETAHGWQFGFDKLERWVTMCRRQGIRYFEISHFYTQWGAAHAPKIMGTDWDGRYRRLFGWETEATSEEYRTFLRAFISAFLAEMKRLDADRDCFFHISDEPHADQCDSYRAAREQIADLLDGYRIMDALSDIALYQSGTVSCPIPSTAHTEPFLAADIPNLWVYYCCGYAPGVSNRFISMTSDLTRAIGLQFWKYRIAGFLQWGYNFYYSCGSIRRLNPYLINDGDFWTPPGDPFAVYPGMDGEPLESLHQVIFTLALQDTRALQFAETLGSREELLALVESEGEITFSHHPRGKVEFLREKINTWIENHLA